MRPVDRYQELLHAPLGRYFAGRQVLVFCPDASLLGVTLWGCPGADDVALLVELLDFPHHPALAGGCDVLFDARYLERLDGEVFDSYVDALRARRDALAARVRRQALLREAQFEARAEQSFVMEALRHESAGIFAEGCALVTRVDRLRQRQRRVLICAQITHTFSEKAS